MKADCLWLVTISCLCGLVATGCTLNDYPTHISEVSRADANVEADAATMSGTELVEDGGAESEEDSGSGAIEETSSATAASGQQGGQADGGVSDAGAEGRPATPPVECTFGDRRPCEVFVSGDREIPLGPYGAEVEYNVGQGFENVPLSDALANALPGISGPICALIDMLGPGAALGLPVVATGDRDFALYTVYAPADLVEGERYPVLLWGSAPCIPPEGYGALLRSVASQGYIVVAPNNRMPGPTELIRGLDFIFDADQNRLSPYYGIVDTSSVGAMGHSLGANAATNAARQDSRIETLIIFNANERADVPFLVISADDDLRGPSVGQLENVIQDVPGSAFIYYHSVNGGGQFPGQYLLMSEPDRVLEPTWRWFEYYFFDDQVSGDLFVGGDCGLCDLSPELTYGQYRLR